MTDCHTEIDQVVAAFFEKWRRQMKMAKVIGAVISHFQERGISIHEDEVARHLYRLIDEGDFETYGNIKKWRQSEIVPRSYLKAD